MLATLNHPNIAAIYGFEESNNVQALVLELVDGPTLADRMAMGTLPLDESLNIARKVAEALEASRTNPDATKSTFSYIPARASVI